MTDESKIESEETESEETESEETESEETESEKTESEAKSEKTETKTKAKTKAKSEKTETKTKAETKAKSEKTETKTKAETVNETDSEHEHEHEHEHEGEKSGLPPSQLKHLAVPLVILGVVAVYLWATHTPKPEPTTAGKDEPHIRVAILQDVQSITLTLHGKWRAEPEKGQPLELTNLAEGKLVKRAEGLAIGREMAAATKFPGSSWVTFKPLPGAEPGQQVPILALGKRQYRGELTVKALPTGRLIAINRLGIEDYLAGVIPYEMPLRWADEACKAQAIAARTYALRSLKPHRDYDVVNTARDQVYRGIGKRDERARKIVAATRGQVVKEGGKMVMTYFHSTCGGDTVPAFWIFSWVKEDHPALRGATRCTCQPSKYYRWEKEVDLTKVKKLGLELPLKKVEVEHWPRAEYVKQVTMTGADGQTKSWPGYPCRFLLKLRSPSYTLTLGDDGKTIEAKGRGWGHGIGLCQYGANGFAGKGLSAVQIIEHFYPGAKVETLSY